MKKSQLDAIIDQEVAKMVKAITQKANAKPVDTLTLVNKAGEAITSSGVRVQKAAERTRELQAAIKAAMGGKPAASRPTTEEVRKAGGNTVLAFIRAQRANGSKS